MTGSKSVSDVAHSNEQTHREGVDSDTNAWAASPSLPLRRVPLHSLVVAAAEGRPEIQAVARATWRSGESRLDCRRLLCTVVTTYLLGRGGALAV